MSNFHDRCSLFSRFSSSVTVRITGRNKAHSIFPPGCCLGRARLNLILLSIIAFSFVDTSHADELPLVSGVSYDGRVITWDVQEGAIGYNVYRNRFYLDTIIEGTTYTPEEAGNYQIVAFDGNGNFTPLAGAMAGVAVVGDVLPFLAPPQNVSGTTWSNSAGEVFWDREPSRRLTYTVSLNNEEFGTTEGNSFFINALLPDASNTVTVTASTPLGTTSTVVSLLFDTTLPNFPAPATVSSTAGDSSSPEAGPMSPQNATIAMYDPTLRELFWDRADADENVVLTEVFRDGEFIGTSPGNSFFTSIITQEPTIFELIAVNANGQRSDATTVISEPFFDAFENLFRPLLEGISDVVNFNPIQFGFTGIESILSEEIPFGLAEVSVDTFIGDTASIAPGLEITVTEYTCTLDSIGSLVVESTGIPVGLTSFSFNDCLFFDNILNGQVTVTISGDTGFTFEIDTPDMFTSSFDFTENFSYQGFTIENDDQSVTMDGSRFTTAISTTEQQLCDVFYDNFSYSVREFDGDSDEDSDAAIDTRVTLASQRLVFSEETELTNTFTTSFSASAPWTGGQTLQLATTDVFSGAPEIDDLFSPFYSRGRFFAELDNGDNLTLTADTGDIETWFAEANTIENGTNTASAEWNQLIRLPFIDVLDCGI